MVKFGIFYVSPKLECKWLRYMGGTALEVFILLKKCKPGSKCKLGSKCIRGTDSCIVGSFNRFHFFFHFNDIAHEHDKTVNFVCNLSFRE